MISCDGGAERVTVSFGQELGAACLEILVVLLFMFIIIGRITM